MVAGRPWVLGLENKASLCDAVWVDGGSGKRCPISFDRGSPAVFAYARVTPRAGDVPFRQLWISDRARVMPLAIAPLGLRPAAVIGDVVSSQPSQTQGREETSMVGASARSKGA